MATYTIEFEWDEWLEYVDRQEKNLGLGDISPKTVVIEYDEKVLDCE